MDELAKFHEPNAEQLEMALNMRRQFTAFLAVGFTDEQALRMVIACIGTVRTQV
jgi:hypothetical protein